MTITTTLDELYTGVSAAGYFYPGRAYRREMQTTGKEESVHPYIIKERGHYFNPTELIGGECWLLVAKDYKGNNHGNNQ